MNLDAYADSSDATVVGQTQSPRLKSLSCQRCRIRKVKCDFGHPCSSCVKIGADCIRITNDMRKKRPPANYVSSLEKKITALSSFFDTFKKLDSVEAKSQFLNNSDLDALLVNDTFQSFSSHYSQPDDREESKIRPVYGPTSVYDSDMASKTNVTTRKREESAIHQMNKDPDILHCLKLFFKWQYPDHNMFIFREAFLTDFFHPKTNSSYCSRNLVLSLCALGSRMSDSETIYSKSIQYYNEARSSLLSRLDQPSIPSLQSFLLLAFYDICNGHNSSGWMLSGNAMRMGFDLGFQLNPELWFLKEQNESSALDVSIRSRIYWGSYLADHFISLVLGRPSLLKMSDASIPETDNLPDLEWIDEYRYISPEESNSARKSNISDPLKSVINLINISDNVLHDIFTKSEFDQVDEHHNIEDLNLSLRLVQLFEYNAQIKNWKSNLPKDLNWDKEKLEKTSDNPSLASVKYYYYILILCLNRPFVGITRDFKDKQHLSPVAVCDEAIEDLYAAVKRFREVHGLRRASIFIVYCCILSISVMLLTNINQQKFIESKDKIEFFLTALNECSRTWKLAEKSLNLIEIKLRQQFGDELEGLTDLKFPQTKRKPAKMQKRKAPPKRLKQEEKTLEITETPKNDVSKTNEQLLSGQIPEPIATSGVQQENQYIAENNTELLVNDNSDFFGGPPVLMTSDLFNEDWEALFPDYVLHSKHG